MNDEARLAYEAYADYLELPQLWDQLTPRERVAWSRVADKLYAEQEDLSE